MSKNWSTPARYLILVLSIILVVALGWYIRPIFQPLVIAGLFAYIMMPLVNLMKDRFGLKHKLAVNLVYFLSLGLVLASPVLFIPELIAQIQVFSNDLVRIYEEALVFLSEPIRVGTFVFDASDYLVELESSVLAVLTGLPEQALHIIESTSRNAAWFFVIIVAVYYFLLDWDKLRELLIRQAPEKYRRDARLIFLEIKELWAAYLRSQIALMAIVGTVFTIAWFSIGLPGALIIGILTGLLNIIPDVGPMVAMVIALAVALLEGSLFLPISNFWFAVLIFIIFLVLVNLKNIWLRPRLMGRSVHLHEGLVFVAIMAAVLIQGILSAIVIVPVIASALVIGRYLKAGVLGLEPNLREDLLEEIEVVEDMKEEADETEL
ncbi:MAG: AI-2E family transporter [Anaerolineae bacterium]|jgi:predicted PurR-regulated permease PerM|nr:AI-2E family transporter [Anaerolineae bacterium]MBT3714252.1 AI-2E family transporter [Anaerolineae bacterium]MBT4312062.1 AI-2E family transporter [Anaerolineae bacterium]MBT4459450.1 AI-2E family transporter [Anaerolineae bacterium]MBT4842050.1 AI-2E family transporter [Anaerolineae bacterium]